MSKNVLDAAFINNDMAFKHFLANKYAIYIHKLICSVVIVTLSPLI